MKIGFIGAGHMGGAMIEGLVRSKIVSPEELFVKGGSSGTAEKLQEKLNFQLVENYQDLNQCNVIFIATGAKIVLTILQELGSVLAEESVLISVAAGHTIEEAETAIGRKGSVVHAIPNTPVSVNEGMIGVSYGSVSESKKEMAEKLLKSLGRVRVVTEGQLGTVGTVAGCSPAFVDIMMEALADAAVMEGLPRELSYEIVEQMVLGSAKLAIETGKHPGELKDGVTSPGGTTIKGVAALEKNGFRYALIDAVKQANS